MDSFLKTIIEGKSNAEAHRYFIRFGKGNYRRRFLISVTKGTKIKVKGSFELANDFLKFAKENGNFKYTGKVFTREKVAGKEGKKKAGVFVYELNNSTLEGFDNVYFYLLNTQNPEYSLKVKKSLPKPGKDAEKIDDSFCVVEISPNLWNKFKDTFFWDVPEGKKTQIEHELKITDIVFPQEEKDPVKIRELAKRKGTIVRKITIDEKESSKEYPLEA